MGSLIARVLKENRNSRNSRRRQQKQKVDDIRQESMYAYRLRKAFDTEVDKYLDLSDVSSVFIRVPEESATLFIRSMYRDEFSEYCFVQTNDNNVFEVSRKELYIDIE